MPTNHNIYCSGCAKKFVPDETGVAVVLMGEFRVAAITFCDTKRCPSCGAVVMYGFAEQCTYPEDAGYLPLKIEIRQRKNNIIMPIGEL